MTSYDIRRFPFMLASSQDLPPTDASVSIPPALVIRDDQNAVWTLGFDYDEREWRNGKLEYDVVRNSQKTGEFARVIECAVNSRGNRVVRIWGSEGWRTWNGKTFV